ncbi:MAG: hypothetical protein ACREN4_00190 [Candidatus Dormibacteria bacterium]
MAILTAGRGASGRLGSGTPTTAGQSLRQRVVANRVLALWVVVSLAALPTDTYLFQAAYLWLALMALAALAVVVVRPSCRFNSTLVVACPLAALAWLTPWDITGNGVRDIVFVFPAAVSALAVARLTGPRERALATAIVWVAVIGAVVTTWHWGVDNIDVFHIVQQGALQVPRGLNPYHSWFASTTPGIRELHYPYGPILLLLSLPAAAVGDVRLLSLAAALGILALGYARLRHLRGGAPLVVMLLVSPWLVWPMLQSWTELVAMALLLGWYGLHERWRGSWVLLGLAVGVNALVLIVAIPIFLVRPSLRRHAAAGMALAVACYGGAFLVSGHSLIGAFLTAAHPDWSATIGVGGVVQLIAHRVLPSAVAVGVFAIGCSVALLRRPATPLGQELAVAAISAATVWCLPASYFEYLLMPMLWCWWWLGSAALDLSSREMADTPRAGGLPTAPETRKGTATRL